jgi:hypothetical protein
MPRRHYGLSRFVTDTGAHATTFKVDPQDSATHMVVIPSTARVGIEKVRGFRLELSCSVPCVVQILRCDCLSKSESLLTITFQLQSRAHSQNQSLSELQ